MACYDFAKHQKTVSYTTFCNLHNSRTKYLMNLSFIDTFGSLFGKWPPKVSKKQQGFALQTHCVSRCRTTWKTLARKRFGACNEVEQNTLWNLSLINPPPFKNQNRSSKGGAGFNMSQKILDESTKPSQSFFLLKIPKIPLNLQFFPGGGGSAPR